jgi:hypothetical protein
LTTKNIPEGIFILCENVTLDGEIPLENLEKLKKLYPEQIQYISEHYFNKNDMSQLQKDGKLKRPIST